MNVLQVVNSLECGGLEKLVIHLTQKLNEEGTNTLIACLGSGGELAEEARKKGLRVICLNKRPGLDLFVVLRLSALIHRERIDVVHTHNFPPLMYGTLAARLANVKVMNTRHGRAERSAKPLIWKLNHRIAAVSEDAKTEMLRHNVIDPAKVSVIYNAVNPADFNLNNDEHVRQLYRKKLGISPETLLLGIVARLAQEKDHLTLIKAFEQVARKLHNVELLIIGDGPLLSEVKRFARNYEVEHKVRFLGFRDDIPLLLNILNVFVLSSKMEGISMTLLEAMAAAKPIVATDVGGNPEVVDNGRTGLLVSVGNPEAMAAALLKILQNPELAAQMGTAGRKRLEGKFDLGRMIDSYTKLYEEMVA